MHLIVEGKGLFLGKHQGRLRVSREGKALSEAPILHLEQVVIVDTGVAISSDVIRTCAEEGIPIYFISTMGHHIAGLYSAGLTGTVLTRRAQLGAFEDERGFALARAFVMGKIENQRALLRYMGKYRKGADPGLYEELTLVAAELGDHLAEAERFKAEQVSEVRDQLLSVEGRAASRYWGAIKRVIPAELGWPGRETQGAQDLFNAALNYGYGILYAQVERALVLAGLDPYGGFLHADRPGKPSLVLDLIEEFRQTVVDRTLIGQVNRGFAIARDEQGRLDKPTRDRLVERIRERMESAELYESKRQALRFILQCQARHLATFVRRERPTYTPFLAAW
ncbi:MAG TPA: CRISPR-associated endonuclease Cas1 [Ktedonobacterales bacterium]